MEFNSASFQDWAQEQAGKLLDLWGQAQVTQPYEIEKLRLRALGDGGYYEEGKAGTSKPASSGGNMLPLLVGGVILLLIVKG